jgi:leader peptidase (prepilin peptidase) / N-methyltransferase
VPEQTQAKGNRIAVPVNGDVWLAALGLLLGAIIGSFLATILVRWPSDESVMRGRSRCDACGRTLPARNLVPILSFLLQSGRCQMCGAPIAWDHLAMEIAASAIGGFAGVLFAPGLAATCAMFGWLLLLLAALDARHFWLPDRLTVLLLILGLTASAMGFGPQPRDAFIGALTGFASLSVVALAYSTVRKRDGIGGGDPKLLGAIGAWVGWQPLPHIVLAAAILGLIAVLALRLHKSGQTFSDQIAFGTFLALAAWPLWIGEQLRFFGPFSHS